MKKLALICTIFLLMFLPVYAKTKSHTIPPVHAKVKRTHAHRQNDALQVTHISRAQLDHTPPVSVARILMQEQSIVRVSNASGDNSQTILSIRGFGDNAAANTLILTDGFPLTNPTLLAPNINAIALEDIANIRIDQGSQGVLWGDQAVGGVVNFTARRPKKFIGNMNVSAGSFHQRYTSALLGNKMTNNINVKGYYLRQHTDNYREHNDFTMTSGLARIGYDYAQGYGDFTIRDYHTTTFLPGGLTQTQYDANPRQATNFRNLGRYHTTITQLLSKHELNEHWLLETRLSNQAINGDGFVMVPFTRNEWEVFFNPRLIGHLKQHKIVAGYSGQLSHFHMNSRLINDTANEQQQTIYAQVTSPLPKHIQVIIGARQAWQNNQIKKQNDPTLNATDKAFVSELGLSYKPKTTLQFYARRAGSFSFAKANQQTWTFDGTTSLEPQTGISYEAGATAQTEKQKVQLSLYQLDLHDEIAFNPTSTANQPFGAYQNFQDTRRIGATLAATYKPLTPLTFSSQINYVDARFKSGTFNGKHIPAVPTINLNLGIDYCIQKNWSGKYYGIYNGKAYASEDNANTGKQVPGYWLHNIALQYKFNTVLASFEVDNLFNQRYAIYTLYDVDTQQNTFYPGAGRSYNLTMKASID